MNLRQAEAERDGYQRQRDSAVEWSERHMEARVEAIAAKEKAEDERDAALARAEKAEAHVALLRNAVKLALAYMEERGTYDTA